MNKYTMARTTMDFYRGLGYSEKTMICLAYLESRCENLAVFLEEYRHLQPDGKPFSEGILGLIKELCDIQESCYELHHELLQIKEKPMKERFRPLWDEPIIPCVDNGLF